MNEEIQQMLERVGAKVVGHHLARQYTTDSGSVFYLDKVKNGIARWTFGDVEVKSAIQDGRPAIIHRHNVVAQSGGCFLPNDVYREILKLTAAILAPKFHK